MSSNGFDMIVILGCILISVCVIALLMLACGMPSRAAVYQSELVGCVEMSETRSEYSDCVERVRRRYGRWDGGRHDSD